MFPGSLVRLQLYEEGGGEVTLQKNDTGMGLPPAECHRVLLIPPCMRDARLRRGKSRPHIPPYK